jgi:hypothetical protein
VPAVSAMKFLEYQCADSRAFFCINSSDVRASRAAGVSAEGGDLSMNSRSEAIVWFMHSSCREITM